MDDISFNIEYSFSKPLETGSFDRFITQVTAQVVIVDEDYISIGVAGKVEFSLVHLSLAKIDKVAPLNVFAWQDELFIIGNMLIDSKTNEWVEHPLKDYDFSQQAKDILFLESIELLPPYRGQGLGDMVMFEMMSRFYGSVGLMVTMVEPTQFFDSDILDEWDKMMEFSALEQDEERARYKLFAFFQECGWKLFDEENGIFLFNPVTQSDVLANPNPFVPEFFPDGLPGEDTFDPWDEDDDEDD